LRDQLTGGAPEPVPDYPGCPPQQWFQRGTVFVTADGSAATFVSCALDGTPIPLFDSTIGYPSGVLLLRDGTRYRIDSGLVSSMQDRNGNRIAFFYDSVDPQGHPDGRVTRIIDSLNRQVTISYDVNAAAPYGLCDQISFKGFGGEVSRTITVSKDSMSHVLRSGFVRRTYHDLFPTLSGSSSTPFDPTVVSRVWLPDGRSYQFQYNDYGELSRVVLPTGDALEYDWVAGMINSPTGGAIGNGQIYRRVSERRIYPDGATGGSFSSKETYSVPETYAPSGPPPNVGYVAVKQYDSSLNLLTSSKHYFNGSAVYNPNADNYDVGYFPWSNGKEYKSEALDSDDFTVLQRVEHSFDQTAPAWWNPPFGCNVCVAPSNNPHITQTRTTWVKTNQMAQQLYFYDQYNNKTIIQEFDYGTGSPPANATRRTEIDYVAVGELNGIDYTGSNISSNVNGLPHLRSLPQEQRVFSQRRIEHASVKDSFLLRPILAHRSSRHHGMAIAGHGRARQPHVNEPLAGHHGRIHYYFSDVRHCRSRNSNDRRKRQYVSDRLCQLVEHLRLSDNVQDTGARPKRSARLELEAADNRRL
jgi:YD repeat-containing protein